jgi:hypothetical protein
MKKLIKKLLLFLIIPVIYILFVILADPYNYFGISQIISEKNKRLIGLDYNQRLYKMLEFKKKPKVNILIGDSRMYDLNTNDIKRITGLEFYNMAFGGSSLYEINETFNFVKSVIKPEKVYVGINFLIYNYFYNYNKVNDIQKYFDNTGYYFVDRNVFLSCYHSVLLQYFNIYKKKNEKFDYITDSVQRKKLFWDWQLNKSTPASFAKFKVPEEQLGELVKIVKYCENNNIEFRFVIFPEHNELLEKYRAIGLNDEFEKFKKRIKSIATTIDFSEDIEKNSRYENFKDPYHYTQEYEKELIPVIFR